MEDSDNWFLKGVALFENHNYPGAISAFEKAITFNQSPIDAWFNRGLVFAEMGQYKPALASFDETLARDPGHEHAKMARNMVLERMAAEEAAATTVYAATGPRRSNASVSATPRAAPAPGTDPIVNPLLAVLSSFIFPGWGQWYTGRRWEGLFFFGASIVLGLANVAVTLFLKSNILISAVFTLLGLALWISGMYHAYTTAIKINNGDMGFMRKSRLFWLPVAIITLAIALLVFSVVLAFLVFGKAGAAHSPSSTSFPAISPYHTRVVAATAMQPDSKNILVTYQGGRDAPDVMQVVVNVTDMQGKTTSKTMGLSNSTFPLDPGGSLSFNGNYVGQERVLAIARFMDGSEQVILDTSI